jgi:type VI secretion system protein VasI
MALTKCKECKKEISSNADKRIHCGAPTKSKIGCGTIIGYAILIPFFYVGAMLAFVDTDVSEKKQIAAEPQEQVQIDLNPRGKWQISTSKNPIDDTETVLVSLEAESGRGKYGRKVKFVVRCMSNKTEVFVDWDSFLDLEQIQVISRIGENKAETLLWDVSTDRKSSIRPRPIQFLKDIMNSDILVLKTTPYGDNTITAIFDTKKLDKALELLRDVCGW